MAAAAAAEAPSVALTQRHQRQVLQLDASLRRLLPHKLDAFLKVCAVLVSCREMEAGRRGGGGGVKGPMGVEG